MIEILSVICLICVCSPVLCKVTSKITYSQYCAIIETPGAWHSGGGDVHRVGGVGRAAGYQRAAGAVHVTEGGQVQATALSCQWLIWLTAVCPHTWRGLRDTPQRVEEGDWIWIMLDTRMRTEDIHPQVSAIFSELKSWKVDVTQFAAQSKVYCVCLTGYVNPISDEDKMYWDLQQLLSGGYIQATRESDDIEKLGFK